MDDLHDVGTDTGVCKSVVGRFRRTLRRYTALSCLFSFSSVAPAAAQNITMMELFGQNYESGEVILFSVFFGCLAAAMVAAVLGMRERGRLSADNEALRKRLAEVSARNTQLAAAAAVDGQTVLIWANGEHKPEMTGALDHASGAPAKRAAFLAFGRWFEPRSAARLDSAINALREKAQPFSDVLKTVNGTPIEIVGRTVGGSAIVRFSNLTTERAQHFELLSRHAELSNRVALFEANMQASPSPTWIHDADGRLAWANDAYLHATGHTSLEEASANDAKLFGSQALTEIMALVKAKQRYEGEVATVVGGNRLVYDVTVTELDDATFGIAHDKTDVDNVRRELSKTIRSHEETLDGLNTAVAMFDDAQRLKFYNQSFREFWDLAPGFLEQEPDMSMFLNELRTAAKVQEMPEWQRWKNDITAQFQALEPHEDWWHLPDGRTVRVLTNPHPKGGLTWVFENFTERRDLESRLETLVRVQSETLDHLAEGVAVFAADGHLELSNPAFAEFWGLEKLLERPRVHISSIQRTWDAASPEMEFWSTIVGFVTGFDDERGGHAGRVDLDDQILSWSAVPLPNGQTMITFMDVTGPEQIERALRERNEALERTAHLRNRFIHHVSYELRAPLTNIMGFTELLQMEKTGALNEVQAGYVGNIGQSSHKLMEITDDILDLATIDAGLFALDVSEVDLTSLMTKSANLVSDRFKEHDIELLVRVDPDVGAIHADADRLQKVFVNILKNAAAFAPQGSTVPFTCKRITLPDSEQPGVSITVRDKGPGIDEDMISQLFERFETGSGGRARGTGLGLPLARSFVDLHDGDIQIHSTPGQGTTVEIVLPDTPHAARMAAE